MLIVHLALVGCITKMLSIRTPHFGLVSISYYFYIRDRNDIVYAIAIELDY